MSDDNNSTESVVSTWSQQYARTGSMDPQRLPVKTVVRWTYDTQFDSFTTDRYSDDYCNMTTTGRCLLTSNRSLYEVSSLAVAKISLTETLSTTNSKYHWILLIGQCDLLLARWSWLSHPVGMREIWEWWLGTAMIDLSKLTWTAMIGTYLCLHFLWRSEPACFENSNFRH